MKTIYASRFRLKVGMQSEYKRRHDEIWPEMISMMKEAGISNYSIWNSGEDLFQCFEVENIDRCRRVIAGSEVKKRWDDYMKDIIYVDASSSSSFSADMELMFYMK